MNAINLSVGLILIAAASAPVGAIGVQQTTTPTTAAADVTECARAQMVADQLLAAAMARLDGTRQANTAADLRAAVDSLQSTMRDVRAQLAACASVLPAADAPMDHAKMPMGTAPATKPATVAAPGAPSPMDHSKMQMGTPSAGKPGAGQKPAAAAPMDHSKMPLGTAPAPKPATGGKPPAPPARPPTTPVSMDHSKMSMGATADPSAKATDPVCGLKVDPASAPQASDQGQTCFFCSEQHRQLFQKNPAKYLPHGK